MDRSCRLQPLFGLVWLALPCVLSAACAPADEEDAETSTGAVGETKPATRCEKRAVSISQPNVGQQERLCVEPGEPLSFEFTNKLARAYDVELSVSLWNKNLADPVSLVAETKIAVTDDAGVRIVPMTPRWGNGGITLRFHLEHAEKASRPVRFSLKTPKGVKLDGGAITASPFGNVGTRCVPAKDAAVCYTGRCKDTVQEDGAPGEPQCF